MLNNMRNLGISRVHNSSTTLLENGEIVYHLENERLSSRKYDAFPFQCLTQLDTKNLDNICIAGVGKLTPADCFISDDAYSLYVKTKENKYDTTVHDLSLSHHGLHAAHAFYNSGFNEAICIVKDGMGSDVPLNGDMFQPGTFGRELTTTFTTSYPAKFDVIDKHVAVPFEASHRFGDVFISNNLGEGMAFQKTSMAFGFHELDAGKVMGVASYGEELPISIYQNGLIDNELFYIGNDLHGTGVNYIFEDFQTKADFAFTLQKQTQEYVGQYILDMIEKTGCKNVCLSGGFFLNCVANYYYLSILPKDVNLYIEPVSSDAGTSIGAAKYVWHKQTNDTTKRPLQSLYLGPERTMCPQGKYVTDDDVADLLIDGKVVAIYQGRSEAGPRALGNRSILFDPRNPAAKDIINRIKKREEFRPFAGTVMAEYADEYFDMRGLKESPFMMYAVNVLSDKIPGITHVDNTCRIQTVTKEQNTHYYNLIKCFHKKTGVPILFNTSFNLAGECIVETPEDAIRVVNNSDIDYVYFAEFKVLYNGQ
ncbi:carbamoyltransferase [Synechococcus phage S-CAM8]|uniref:Carbamoyltransferase n=1 Tax=Synechococcus phage S-CAM8 TaxID=754038 RepID=G8EXU7_9CAUD|nr:carbamoyltransferase [Synechococcus phage S-CAM8]